MTSCPLVMIEWLDSVQPQGNWSYLSGMEAQRPIRCVSVGWLVTDSGGVKSLAPNMGSIEAEHVQVSGLITIPNQCVTRMHRLKEPKVKL